MEKTNFLDHLIELRKRLLYCLGFFFLAFCGCYYFSDYIFNFLVQPLAKIWQGHSRRMIYTGLAEAFLTYVKVAFFSALFVSFPVFAWQIWKFIAPGLYVREKATFRHFMWATPCLFFLGGALAYYVVCPIAYAFFLSFEVPSNTSFVAMQLEARVGEYLSLVLKLIFAFGLCFQLPLVVVLFARLGILHSEWLKMQRKYAFLLIVVIAAIITPPDLITPISLIIPLYGLYEISIILVKGIERKHHPQLKDI